VSETIGEILGEPSSAARVAATVTIGCKIAGRMVAMHRANFEYSAQGVLRSIQINWPGFEGVSNLQGFNLWRGGARERLESSIRAAMATKRDLSRIDGAGTSWEVTGGKLVFGVEIGGVPEHGRPWSEFVPIDL
jgi:hypothetical protein